MPNITHIDEYLKSKRPYCECACGCDSFNIILSDWSDNWYVCAIRCEGCGEIAELDPIIECEIS